MTFESWQLNEDLRRGGRKAAVAVVLDNFVPRTPKVLYKPLNPSMLVT